MKSNPVAGYLPTFAFYPQPLPVFVRPKGGVDLFLKLPGRGPDFFRKCLAPEWKIFRNPQQPIRSFLEMFRS